MSNDPAIDPKTLELLRSLESDRPGAMTELVRLFIADAPAQMQLVDDGYHARDAEKLRQAAHFLRSGALALGLNALVDASHDIERLEPDQYGTPESDALLAQLRVGLRDALMALLNIVKEL